MWNKGTYGSHIKKKKNKHEKQTERRKGVAESEMWQRVKCFNFFFILFAYFSDSRVSNLRISSG